ncbi:MAG: hypothetical protein HYX76_07020 [Acidobacteria bacterium]|nr:hypothetical protein [Acidobacteriota bacterium]
MPTEREVQEENRRLRYVRWIVNFTSSVIMQGGLTRAEGEELVASARARILDLFPGRDETYELLYARRFNRLLDEFTRPAPARVIPFPQARES